MIYKNKHRLLAQVNNGFVFTFIYISIKNVQIYLSNVYLFPCLTLFCFWSTKFFRLKFNNIYFFFHSQKQFWEVKFSMHNFFIIHLKWGDGGVCYMCVLLCLKPMTYVLCAWFVKLVNFCLFSFDFVHKISIFILHVWWVHSRFLFSFAFIYCLLLLMIY